MREKHEILKDVLLCLDSDYGCSKCSYHNSDNATPCNNSLYEEFRELVELLEKEEDDLK